MTLTFSKRSILDQIRDVSAGSGRGYIDKIKQVLSKFRPRVGTGKSRRILIGVFIGITLVVVSGLLLASYSYSRIKSLQSDVAVAETAAREVYASLKGQDLILANQQLLAVDQALEQIEQTYMQLAFYRHVPYLGTYFKDGVLAIDAAKAGLRSGHILLDTIEPYADVLGFAGEGTFSQGTAEDRIIKIIETMDKVAPALDQVALELETVNTLLAQIDSSRYPFEVRGEKVDQVIGQVQDWASIAASAVLDVKPLLEVLPSVAGLEKEKVYLVIFQNDAEIRPTGGFITAYGVLRVDKGKVFQEKSEDIYALDAKFNSRIPAPEVLRKYLTNINVWHLRDMNLSPDFVESMNTFMTHYRQVPGENADRIDGIVAVDTQVLSDLISVLGPTEVPGFGTYSADIDPRCDCPQVIYELEDFATRPRAYLRDDRKSFLGPMLQTILQKAYAAPNEAWPRLFEVVVSNVVEKHVLFYMFDAQAQAAAERANIAGRIKDYQGDYLHINDTNLGGAKSNLFITTKVDLNVETSAQGTANQLEVTYRNPAPASNCNLEAGKLCLNGIYRNWVRFYLPLGSQLVEATGLDEGSVKVSEDLGKTVIEGFFKFAPKSQARVRLSYTTPYVVSDQYRLLIQKQPGQKLPEYTVTFNQVDQQVFELGTDKEVVFVP